MNAKQKKIFTTYYSMYPTVGAAKAGITQHGPCPMSAWITDFPDNMPMLEGFERALNDQADALR